METQNGSFKNVCVIGLGYIGLPTASLLASSGFQVHGVDINQNAVDKINQGEAHIVEPDLNILVSAGVNSKRLKADIKPAPADVFIVAVPTPFKGDHQPDLSYVEAAVDSICPFLMDGNLVILESTSPVGTTQMIHDRILFRRAGLKVNVAYCPERVLPGAILKELIENDRIVGGVDEVSTRRACEFYQSFVKGDVLSTNSKTAEMSKLSENAFRDVNIAFANELSRVCDGSGIDVWELIALANRHPRVKILRPGPGVGGHCIAVDPWFIVASDRKNTALLQAARNVNDTQPFYVLDKVKPHYSKLIESKRSIAVLGLAYKPNIDDLRESPAVEIVKHLAQHFKGPIEVVEPYVDQLPQELANFSNVKLRPYLEAIDEAGLVLALVMHDEFKNLEVINKNKRPVIDTVGLLKK